MGFLQSTLTACAALLAFAGAASAQAKFPSKAIEMIVYVTPGGGADLAARSVARHLERTWKVPVRVINRPGGNMVPAIQEVMRAPPDGHTILVDGLGSASLFPIVVPNVPLKVSDRTFISLMSTSPMFFAVPTNSPIKSVGDMVEALKKDPAALSWTALGGTGSIDVAFRRLFQVAGIPFSKTRPVMIKGGSDAAVQTGGGHVDLGAGSYTSFLPMLTANRVRLLAVTAPQRQTYAKDIPTTAELGYPTVLADSWLGLSGPSNTPKDVVARWEAAVKEALNDPQVKEDFARLGLDANIGDGETMRQQVEKETAEFKSLYARN